ncbi:hypothetical protein [Algoriphagus aquimarinus]|uniref:Molybdenum ABC transporter permease n=1 Tax=Algoriphagus aquimarinus TaxID=237018 RepID=A0A1I1AE20_9BACT|nr:hypothetical protein [Algoriphagus aquimarinus]SFB35616.1 hypothetical protein SAMN04489723_1089 [Algoriphagus aquimarinus]
MILEDLIVTVLGGALVLSGFAIRYWVGRRRFERRGLGGLQHYSSYSKALVVSTIERIANLLTIPMILGGIFLLMFWWMFVRDNALSRNKEDVKRKTEHKTDPKAHFLVPAEKGFGEKLISPIPTDSFQLSMNRFV